MEWVSVETRLPEPNKIVLIYLDSGENRATMAGFVYHSDSEALSKFNGNWAAYDGGEVPLNCFLINEFITHWMPLPAPPVFE